MAPGSPLRTAVRAIGGTLALGGGVLAYSLLEARRPVLRRLEVPVLAPGQPPVTILHLSDLHLTAHTEALVSWVRGLARLSPDVVVNTGDNLSLASGLEPLSRALEPFLRLPGAFVMGDHDYRSTVFKLPTRYLRHDPRTADRPGSDPDALPWEKVRDLQSCGGWVDLTNRRGLLHVGGYGIELVGVDDPHVDRDVFPAPAPSAHPVGSPGDPPVPLTDTWGRRLRLGLLHAPYRRVLEAMEADGVSLALAGHTHGGQLCVPGYGALVTNCDLDRSRASGLSWWQTGQAGRTSSPRVTAAASQGQAGSPRPSGMYLHVCAGLGTSPYTPVRLACPPQATLLTLRPAD
ncbi:metallophosphoesterase [Actinomyces lilanjuaniae]|uniref:metallophosphoesterase n=1 Tax=Actinomyces lilanjuaniae TaxID=2321394 RepID=UPI001968FA65|nr:metallophosphoesterase [Actinomyces lilanjuaniae]